MLATTPPFTRRLYPPSSPNKSEGDTDVLAVKRAISRAGYWTWQEFNQAYTEQFSKAVANFRKKHGMTASQVYTEETHAKLVAAKAVAPHEGEPAFDALAVQYMQEAYDRRVKSPEQKKAEELYDFCKLFDGPYVWGGEHDGSFANDDVHDGFDCSSSTSFALAHVGLLGSSMAHVSGWFEWWGDPGPGRYITVHAASDHVWMSFSVPGRKWARFDTSPHGDGPRGPRLRYSMRDTNRFVHRHPRGF
jgi:hypothetical protein